MKVRVWKSKKNVLLTGIFALGVCLVIGLFSVAFILARGQSQLQSVISVAYYSNNVTAKVSGKYWINNSVTKLQLGREGEYLSEITFGDGTASTENIVPLDSEGNEIDKIVLTSKANKIILEYKFTNMSISSNFKIEMLNSPKQQEANAIGAEVGTHCVNMTERYYHNS